MYSIYIVYKEKAKSKPKILYLSKIYVDEILKLNKKKPPIPYEYEILDIGIGDVFEEKFKEKYNINEITDKSS